MTDTKQRALLTRLRDSAQITTLPKWVRDEFTAAADEIDRIEALQSGEAVELLEHVRKCTHCHWCRPETREEVIAALTRPLFTHPAALAGSSQQDGLSALVESWRQQIGGKTRYDIGITRALLMCAEQLETALAASAPAGHEGSRRGGEG